MRSRIGRTNPGWPAHWWVELPASPGHAGSCRTSGCPGCGGLGRGDEVSAQRWFGRPAYPSGPLCRPRGPLRLASAWHFPGPRALRPWSWDLLRRGPAWRPSFGLPGAPASLGREPPFHPTGPGGHMTSGVKYFSPRILQLCITEASRFAPLFLSVSRGGPVTVTVG